MKITGFRVTEAALFGLRSLLVARTARHALVVQFIQVQRWRARGAAELAGAGASSTVGMAALAELG